MSLEKIVNLAYKTHLGTDSIKEKTVGFGGYGFVFRDLSNTHLSFVTSELSSNFCSISSYHRLKKGKDVSSRRLIIYDDYDDIVFGGFLKTFFPSLIFRGDEVLFEVWLFVMTPKDQRFPAIFYYGQSGLSLGGGDFIDLNKIFSTNVSSIINFTPFDFLPKDLELLIEALEYALTKRPLSDFYGIYDHDMGRTLMGVKKGKLFIEEV